MTNTDMQTKPLTLRYLILRYIVVMLLTGLMMAIVDYIVQYFFQYQTSMGMGIVAVIIPAMDAGQIFARRNGRVPENREAWRLSVLFLAVNVAFGAAIVLILTLLSDVDNQMGTALAALITPLGLGLMAGVLVIYLLATRYFFGSGAKNEFKRQTRAAKKQE